MQSLHFVSALLPKTPRATRGFESDWGLGAALLIAWVCWRMHGALGVSVAEPARQNSTGGGARGGWQGRTKWKDGSSKTCSP